MSWRFVFAVAGIAILDIVLSGDNALVIAAAASRLHRTQRLIAIAWGGAGAIVFRILLTIAATEILRVPLLQAAGGVLLMGIAVRVLPNGSAEENRFGDGSTRFFVAIFTILIADATMSLDNILAVGALAHGNIPLLAIGLLFSMAVLFIASTVIARLMEVLGWLIDLAAIIIALTAANLFISDPFIQRHIHFSQTAATGIHVGAVVFIAAVDLLLRWRARKPPAAVVPLPVERSARDEAPGVNGHVSDYNGQWEAPASTNGTSNGTSAPPNTTADERASDHPMPTD